MYLFMHTTSFNFVFSLNIIQRPSKFIPTFEWELSQVPSKVDNISPLASRGHLKSQ